MPCCINTTVTVESNGKEAKCLRITRAEGVEKSVKQNRNQEAVVHTSESDSGEHPQN